VHLIRPDRPSVVDVNVDLIRGERVENDRRPETVALPGRKPIRRLL